MYSPKEIHIRKKYNVLFDFTESFFFHSIKKKILTVFVKLILSIKISRKLVLLIDISNLELITTTTKSYLSTVNYKNIFVKNIFVDLSLCPLSWSNLIESQIISHIECAIDKKIDHLEASLFFMQSKK